MKKPKVPRKLKKELYKVDCIETSRPSFKTEPNPFSSTKMVFTQSQRVKLKDGVKSNKWTKRLVRNILREARNNQREQMYRAMKRQMEWAHKGISPIDSLYERAFRDKSPEEFRREYLNEPSMLPRDLDGLRPSCVIVDDIGEQWQPANRKEVEEFLNRMKLWTQATVGEETQAKIGGILKLPSLTPEQVEEFKANWEKWAMSSQPITLIDPEASVQFFPTKRPHRLHNHPRMEVEHCAEDEVIVDREFMGEFCWYRPVIERNGKYSDEHFIVRKSEFLALLEGKGGAEMKLTTFSDRDTKERALNDVYNLLAFSYKSVAGGFLYKPLDLLSKENTTWHTCLQNGKLKSVMIHKNTHVGKKVILCGCDGTREGKKALLDILLNCLSDKEERNDTEGA